MRKAPTRVHVKYQLLYKKLHCWMLFEALSTLCSGKNEQSWVIVSRLWRFVACYLLTSTQNVPFFLDTPHGTNLTSLRAKYVLIFCWSFSFDHGEKIAVFSHADKVCSSCLGQKKSDLSYCLALLSLKYIIYLFLQEVDPTVRWSIITYFLKRTIKRIF